MSMQCTKNPIHKLFQTSPGMQPVHAEYFGRREKTLIPLVCESRYWSSLHLHALSASLTWKLLMFMSTCTRIWFELKIHTKLPPISENTWATTFRIHRHPSRLMLTSMCQRMTLPAIPSIPFADNSFRTSTTCRFSITAQPRICAQSPVSGEERAAVTMQKSTCSICWCWAMMRRCEGRCMLMRWEKCRKRSSKSRVGDGVYSVKAVGKAAGKPCSTCDPSTPLTLVNLTIWCPLTSTWKSCGPRWTGSMLLESLCSLYFCHRFCCIYCDKIFISSSILRIHMRKKRHFRVHPSCHHFDRFYLSNYTICIKDSSLSHLTPACQQSTSNPQHYAPNVHESTGSKPLDQDDRNHLIAEAADTFSPTSVSATAASPHSDDSDDSDCSEWCEYTEARCLFCDFTTTSEDIHEHLAQTHKINLFHLENVFERIKFVNFVRHHVSGGAERCFGCSRLMNDGELIMFWFA